TWGAGFTTAVLLGMGGSSLAPEVMQQVLGSAPGALEIIVLDTTHPDELLRIVRNIDEERTL
ncbi:MAG: glucose-6-phosphate isomerase, partial [Dehalococcoidia bacterium]|nr:glucose-6-phosphate isomerase [Dehalococcoidia bacterium]